MTDPAAIVALGLFVTVPTTSPAPTIAVAAAACFWFTTFGTATGAGAAPVDTTRLTALPGAANVPPAGVWLITEPEGTVGLEAVVTVPTVRLAAAIAAAA